MRPISSSVMLRLRDIENVLLLPTESARNWLLLRRCTRMSPTVGENRAALQVLFLPRGGLGLIADHFLGPRYLTPTPCGPSNKNSMPRFSRATRSFSIVRSEPGSSEFSRRISVL